MTMSIDITAISALLIGGEWINVHTASVDYLEYISSLDRRPVGCRPAGPRHDPRRPPQRRQAHDPAQPGRRRSARGNSRAKNVTDPKPGSRGVWGP